MSGTPDHTIDWERGVAIYHGRGLGRKFEQPFYDYILERVRLRDYDSARKVASKLPKEQRPKTLENLSKEIGRLKEALANPIRFEGKLEILQETKERLAVCEELYQSIGSPSGNLNAI